MTDVLEVKLQKRALEGTEQLVICDDPASGLRAVVAIDDTTLGPGLGGVRWVPYANDEAAIAEVQRLARVMTLKNACAEIPYGGAKSVILSDPAQVDRVEVMEAFGRALRTLEGHYVPGVDMGTTVDDLAVIGSVGADVACDREDPSPWTALGVYAGIEAAVQRIDRTDLSRHRVVIQGAGHVGESLARLVSRQGADVFIADVVDERAQVVAAATGATVIDPASALTMTCDVLAPCARARVISEGNVGALRCRIVAGAANDILAQRAVAELLRIRGIVYVPDFLINAGGVIQIHALRAGWDEAGLRRAILAIGDRIDAVLAMAHHSAETPLRVGERFASDRIGRDITIPD